MVVPNRAAVGDTHIGPIAETLESIGIVILSTEHGFVACPGRDLHTGRDSEGDCRAWVNADTGVPAIYCFHTSCSAVCAEVNAQLRMDSRGHRSPHPAARLGGAVAPAPATCSGSDVDEAALIAIQLAYHWPLRDIEADPRGRVADPPEKQWPYLVALFPDHAFVWIGRDQYDSGKPGHRYRFRTAGEWLRGGGQPGVFICPNRFLPGSFSRCNENVARRDFLVVESDFLPRDEVGAVFRWVEHAFSDVRLRAVVDTGGKSLHGWFDYPSASTIAALTTVLPRLGCDPAMFRPAQPSRLPGVIRPDTGRYQRLIYFVP